MPSEAKVYGEGLERVAVRPITDSIYWITHCLGELAQQFYADYFAVLPNADAYAGTRIVDYPFSAFLIVDEKPLLIDTLGPKQQEPLLAALDDLLGERPLHTIWISHIELPHAGNAAAIQRQYPQAQLATLAGGDHYQLHALEKAIQLAPGDVLELGAHTLEMVDALFVDHGLSQWCYERSTGLMFTADWAHNLHEPASGQCFQFVDEMMKNGYSEELFTDDIKVNAWYQFPWLAWADEGEIGTAVSNFFKQYEVNILAPSHGNIIRTDMPRYIPMIEEGMRRAVRMPFSNFL